MIKERMVIAVRKDHRLAGLKQISVADLRNENFIAWTGVQPMTLNGHLLALAQEGGFPLRIAQTAPNLQAMTALVGGGAGIAFVPESLRNVNLPSVCFRPLADLERISEIALCYRSDETSLAVWKLLENLSTMSRTTERNTMGTIAWIGLGLMGYRMSNRMRSAGYTVSGFDIDENACRRASDLGITVTDSIAEACLGADAVFTMLPAGPDIKKVLTAKDGVFANIRKGTLVVDCSTIGVVYAHELHDAADKAGAAFVEAPVSGGTEGARDGTLTFMIGGDERHAARVKERLKPMGDYITYVGGRGAGQAAKIVNNLIMGVSVTVNCEATDLAQRLGLDLKAFFGIATHSSADNWSFRLWNPGIGVVPDAPASHGYKAGFKTWLLAKDLHLALEAGRAVGANVATAEAAHALLAAHANTGGADLDATSLVLALAKQQASEPSLQAVGAGEGNPINHS
jgi:3-hydroxyisobutyrate dehydrogenase